MFNVLRCSVALLAAGLLQASPPTAYAIRGARVVTVSGAVLDRGTVLIRDGLIQDVGADLAIPADAWVIDGQGLTVYPGLIDALSTLGFPEAAPAEPGSGTHRTTAPATPPTPAQPAAAPALGPEDRPSNTSWIRAADLASPSDRRIETARNYGFTTAVSFPTRGIFAGQGAILDLAGEKTADMVVSSPAGLYLTLQGAGFSSYPGSLMGVIAYIRQVWLDAGSYRLEKRFYEAHPAGRKRPRYDRALEGLLEAPRVLLPAARAVEIDRMLRFAAELKTPAVLYGAHQGYAAAPLLAKSGTPVLVSLKWPERNREEDPERVDSLRVLEMRDQAPSTPAALEKAGARFAFYTDGISNARDLTRAVRRAIDAGLAPAAAVRAFTLSAAEIYGVADRLGSIDKGKIANLVVTDGDLFQEKTRVKYVFVDGAKFEPLPEAPPPEAESKESAQ